MLLAVDIGNTNIVLGLFADQALEAHFRIRTDSDKMPDEYLLTLKGLFDARGIAAAGITRVVVSSVVPSLTETLVEAIRFLSEAPLLTVTPFIKLNVRLETPNPEEVGSDLIANAVAAYDRYGGACITVDFGTALTFAAVDDFGVFRGAAIAPGLKTASRALSLHTAQLPDVELVLPESAIGENTVHALQSGIVIGYTGLVDRILQKMKAELTGEVAVVATGGLSGAFAKEILEIDAIDPWLTLEGLRIIGRLNP
ncbi:MAG: type III pantothenate kinase [Spirochaetaceae bacterium]